MRHGRNQRSGALQEAENLISLFLLDPTNYCASDLSSKAPLRCSNQLARPNHNSRHLNGPHSQKCRRVQMSGPIGGSGAAAAASGNLQAPV